jgi:hypothetical protein
MCNSAGLQAVAALVATLFAIAGFIVLCIYARDKKTVANVAANQTKDSVIPFIALDVSPDATFPNILSWKMHNQGSGPALNVKIRLLDDSHTKERLSIISGDSHKLLDSSDPQHTQIIARLKTKAGIQADYESLAGEKCRSTFRHSDI